MTQVIQGFGNSNSKLPSIIQDPFSKTKMKSIIIYYRETLFGKGEWDCTGTVEFENGNTSGKQEFNEKTFDEVVVKIKAMINNMD